MKERRRLHYVSYSKEFIMTAQFKHYQLPDGLSEVVWPYHYQLCFVVRCGNSSARLSKAALRPLAQKPVPAIFLSYGIGHEIAFAFWTPPCVMWGGKYGPHLSVWSFADYKILLELQRISQYVLYILNLYLIIFNNFKIFETYIISSFIQEK